MALRDYDFCSAKGGKAFGPYSQEKKGVVYFPFIPDLLYSKTMSLCGTDWITFPEERLLLPRELM